MVYTAQWNIVNDLLFPKDIWRSSDLLLRTSLEANVTTRQRFPTTFMPLKMTSISRKMFPSLSHSLFALTQVFPFSFILTSCLPFFDIRTFFNFSDTSMVLPFPMSAVIFSTAHRNVRRQKERQLMTAEKEHCPIYSVEPLH